MSALWLGLGCIVIGVAIWLGRVPRDEGCPTLRDRIHRVIEPYLLPAWFLFIFGMVVAGSMIR